MLPSRPRALLTEIRLERFNAAFKPAPISLRPFNVVIGRNGSGKSTLLEALQWLDTALRFDTRRASKRYYGVGDLINLRSRSDPPYFDLQLSWGHGEGKIDWSYHLKIEDQQGLGRVAFEELTRRKESRRVLSALITSDERGFRSIGDASVGRRSEFREPDRLALARIGESAADRGVQVVVTTHSPWLLDHVPLASILQVRRIEGDTRYERFEDRPEIQAYNPNVPPGTRYVDNAE